MKRLFLCVALALPVSSQVMEIVTTDDAEQTYFTSSLVLTPSPNPPPGEVYIYRLSGNTVTLYADRSAFSRPDSGDGGVASVHVSGDGQSVALAAMNVCMPDDCGTTREAAEVRGRYAQPLGNGMVYMSRNGEWAVLVELPPGPGLRSGDFAPEPVSATLIHLASGVRTQIAVPAGRANPIASDGTVLVRNPSNAAIGLWKNGEFTEIPLLNGREIVPVALSDDGRRFVFMELRTPSGELQSQLVVRELGTNAETVLPWGGPADRQELLAMSNDGARLLVRSGNRSSQEWRMAVVEIPSGRTTEFLLGPGEFAAAGTMSGTGRAVLLFTNQGRLLRFNNNQELWEPQEVIAASPHLCCGPMAFAPGEVVRLQASLPDGATWENRLFLGDLPVPVLSSDATGVTVQIPWDAAPGVRNARIDYAASSPFLLSQPVTIRPASPRFAVPDPGTGPALRGVTMLRQDFSGPVTAAPDAGDIVHIYMTGLGRVQGAVRNGAPAPVDDIRPLTGSVTCRFLPQTNDAETLFAGLAPGLLGVYQVTVRMPADAGDPLTGLSCRVESDGAVSNLIYLEDTAPVL